MARNIPVSICTIRQRPKREPNFHQIDRFNGMGRSTNVLFSIRKIGCSFRSGPAISFSLLYIANGNLFVSCFYVSWKNFGVL